MKKELTEDKLSENERIIRDYCNSKSYDSKRLAEVLRFGLDHEQLITLCRDILDNIR